MKKSFIHQNPDADTLILFFNGWGMDERAVAHLTADEKTNVVMLNAYSLMNFYFDESFRYNKIHVVAWSLGVWVANQWMSRSGIPVTSAIAINGTVHPIDASRGIAPEVFQATIDNWNERSRERFNARMFKTKGVYDAHRDLMPHRDCEDQHQELLFFKSHVLAGEIPLASWSKALVGDDDLIFLPANQVNAWQGHAEIVDIKAPHYPFINYKSWLDLVK